MLVVGDGSEAQIPAFVDPSYPLKLFFGVNLLVWLVVYTSCTVRHGKEYFVKALLWHDIHAIGLCILSALSLYFDDDKICPELVPILFTLAYFTVDIIDCLVRMDAPFLVHAVLSIGICVFAMREPRYLVLRAVSCGGLTELSSYPLHQWQRSKSKQDFVVFAISFTACRVLWIPYFLPRVYKEMGFGIPVIAGIGLFLLNFAWWFKIVHILLNYESLAEKAIVERGVQLSRKKKS